MAFRYFRRVRLAEGVSLNLSRSGPSLSLGVRGAHVTFGPAGIRKTVGLPGTGFFYTSQSNWHSGIHSADEFTAIQSGYVHASVWQAFSFPLLCILIVLAMVLLCITAHGQTVLPDAPLPALHSMVMAKPAAPLVQPLATNYDRFMWGAILLTHAVDFRLTQECMSRPYSQCHEGVLPPLIQHHESLFAATELSFSAAQVGISQFMRQHKHRRMARVWDATNLVAFTGLDAYVFDIAKGTNQINRR